MNERYRLMCIGDYISQRYNHNPALILVSPSDRGKSDTVDIFIEEHDTAALLPPSSPTGLIDFIDERSNLTTLILDDPSNWGSSDFFNAIQFFKGITKGKVEIARRTKFQLRPAYMASMQTVVFANIEQYNATRAVFKTTGYGMRANTVFTDHNSETKEYIFNIYEKHNLPRFEDVKIIDRKRTENEDKWIAHHYGGHKRKTIQFYACCMSEEDFEIIKPFLLSEKNMATVYETIQFKED